MHPRAMLERVGDEADFKQVDIFEDAPLREAPEAARPVAEAEAVHGSGEQGTDSAAFGIVDLGDNPQAARILFD